MFITEKTISLRDFGAFGPGMEMFLEDSGYEVIDYMTSAHYRLNPNDKETVSLGGSRWGKLDDLLNLTIVALGFTMDGKFTLEVME